MTALVAVAGEDGPVAPSASSRMVRSLYIMNSRRCGRRSAPVVDRPGTADRDRGDAQAAAPPPRRYGERVVHHHLGRVRDLLLRFPDTSMSGTSSMLSEARRPTRARASRYDRGLERKLARSRGGRGRRVLAARLGRSDDHLVDRPLPRHPPGLAAPESQRNPLPAVRTGPASVPSLPRSRLDGSSRPRSAGETTLLPGRRARPAAAVRSGRGDAARRGAPRRRSSS